MKANPVPPRPPLSLPSKVPAGRPLLRRIIMAACVLTLGACIIALALLTLNLAASIGKICIKTGGKPDFLEGCLYGSAPAESRPTATPPRARARN